MHAIGLITLLVTVESFLEYDKAAPLTLTLALSP
jgi:hypothetical protein